jgi:hypothetical protein
MAMAADPLEIDAYLMKKRALAAMLWFYTGWYAGATIALALGLSPVLGPIFGTALAAVVAGDPRRLIWSRSTSLDGNRSAAVGSTQPSA